MKKENIALIAGIAFIVGTGALMIYLESQWLNVLVYPIVAIGSGPYFYIRAKEKQARWLPEAAELEGRSLLDEKEWIFEFNGSSYEALTIINKDGEYTGAYKIVNLPFWKRAVSMFFPGLDTYYAFTGGIFTSHNEPAVAFQKRKENGRNVLEIRNHRGETAGYYKEEKKLTRTNGAIYTADGELLCDVKSKSMMGDFNLSTVDGRFFASYMHGYFEYAMKPQFQKSNGQDLVKVGEELSDNEKTLAAAVVCYWMSYLQRGNR
ncbi:hypothetical protein KP77_30850 [Jeotgalibacillus alimentarius]|uniref:Uncharacterized protein n=1 Tax=Jeotgalibacillus alimentarius TaxID=135826 RepID=A0A0C2RNP0_9BACL|nr:hypothetical protein [Jeotgalibacillus alimentarius]KIL43379.1 hypothetical protein KP77_30850 [Jeotgalibacillus alimentarius]